MRRCDLENLKNEEAIARDWAASATEKKQLPKEGRPPKHVEVALYYLYVFVGKGADRCFMSPRTIQTPYLGNQPVRATAWSSGSTVDNYLHAINS